MAVNDSNSPNTNQNQEAPQAQPTQQTSAPYGQSAQQGRNHRTEDTRPGLGGINSIFQRSGTYDRSETRSAEALRGLKEAARQAVEAQTLRDDFELVRFDRDENRVGLSSLLIVKTMRMEDGRMYTAVRTLMLDSEAINIRPRVINLGTHRIETPTLPQDVYNNHYWSRIDSFIKRMRGDQNLTTVQAGAIVIPSDFDFKDEVVVSQLLIASVNQCDDVLARVAGERPFTVSDIKRPDEHLTTRVDFSGRVREDIVGNPIRSDICITMNRQVTSNAGEDDFYEMEGAYNSVSGFINLEYAPSQVPHQAQPWGHAAPPTQMFTPNFIITEVKQADWIQATTPELYLLALSNAYRVTAGTQWIRSFLPQVGKKGVDPRDIGALGYFSPQINAMIDTKTDTFTDKDFVDLMTQLVRPKPTFMIDINPMGEHSALENYLTDAAFPGENQQRAKQFWIKAADNLTGGRFTPIFNRVIEGQPTPDVVIPTQQEIHLGYYIGQDGEKRDIRDLDVLAMANATQGNMGDFFEWYRTFVDTNVHPAVNLQKRGQFERQFLSKSLVETGRAVRLLLHPRFIEALDQATREAGVQVDFEHMTTIMGGQRFTGNDLVNSYAVSNNAVVGHNPASSVGAGYQHPGVATSGRIY